MTAETTFDDVLLQALMVPGDIPAVVTVPDWQRDARCVGRDETVFFPESKATAMASLQAARAICADCPVRRQCLEFAVANNEAGYGAGTTDRQRVRLRLQRPAG